MITIGQAIDEKVKQWKEADADTKKLIESLEFCAYFEHEQILKEIKKLKGE